MIDPLLALRVKRAWNKLTPQEQALIEPHIADASAELQTILATGKSAPAPSIRELLFLRAALNDDTQTAMRSAELATEQAAALGLRTPVDANGDILGFGTYQLLDPRWLEAAAVWLENIHTPKPGFGAGDPVSVAIPDRLTLALAADWGTGAWGAPPAPSTSVAKAIAALSPEITIHLGDVYYAGTSAAEQANLLTLWPAGKLSSFTLNSNHEMYPAAVPYFQLALSATGCFSAQGGRSVFVLENTNWIIVGLDTAYFSDKWSLYMHGTLDQSQLDMLARVAARGKKVILLSHHNALCEDGSQDADTTALFQSVLNAMKPAQPTFWYWGHVHCAAVYKPEAGQNVLCRCIGHGALPIGASSALANSPNVSWSEQQNANDPNDPVRVLNGFATLSLDGPALAEALYDENGNRRPAFS